MEFQLHPKYRDIVERARELARDMLAPRAAAYDREGRFPRENFSDLAREGFTILTLREDLGGRRLLEDPASYGMVLYELAKGCPSTALAFHMHSGMVHVIMTLGNQEQRKRFAEDFRAGKIIASHGSEATSSLRKKMVMDTRATPHGSGYRVNGRKWFCSMANGADYYVIWCQLGEEEDLAKSMALLVTPAGAPGLRVDKAWDSGSMRATASHSMIYENLEIPASNLIRQGGDPLRENLLTKFAYGYAAVYLGSGGATLDWVLDYARHRTLKPDNVPISTYPTVQRLIGEMNIALEGAILLVQRAGWILGAQGPEAAYSAVHAGKYAAAEASALITERALKVVGGPGLLREHPLERFHRDARAGLVMPPNSETCLENIARSLLPVEAGGMKTE